MEGQSKRCPYCDEPIRFNAIKCKHCGSVLGTDAPQHLNDSLSSARFALAAKYEILEEIGRGGMALVYKAVQRNLDRIVALKVLQAGFTGDRDLVNRFHAEARSIAKLSHRHIVAIYDEGVEQQVHYMAMEYLDGSDLLSLIKKHGKFSHETIVPAIIDIADALDFAHGHGIIHRDVKCSNIIVTKQGRAVLMDFGIAHAEVGDQKTMVGTVMGSPKYMSPEQAEGKGIDARSDLYSLGVVLYYGVTGQLPYSGDTPIATIHKIIHETYTPAREIVDTPPWLDHAISRCLEKDPARRVQSGRELVSILQSKHATPDPRPRRTSFLQSKTLLVVLAAVFACIVLLTMVSMLNEDPVVAPSGTSTVEKPQSPVMETAVPVDPGPGHEVIHRDSLPGSTVVPKATPTKLTSQSIEMPDLKEMTVERAREILEGMKITSVTVVPIAGAPAQAGLVIRQLPKAGSRVAAGSSVSLMVGE
jgi:serine/threonine protein kinase